MWKITHSLLSSWLYAMKEYSPEDSMERFKAALRREQFPPTPAMLAGREFEDLVSEYAREPEDEQGDEAARHFAGLVRGGQEQVSEKKIVTIGDRQIQLHGIADWIKAGTIYDIKRVGRYEVGRFRDSTQHPMYFELFPEAFQFTYLIADNGGGMYMEQYQRDNSRPILQTVEEFLAWVGRDDELCMLYDQHWRAA